MEFSKRHRPVQLSNVGRALVLVVSPFLLGFAASAQTVEAAKTTAPPVATSTPASNPVVKKTDPGDDYKKGLSDLAALYETEVQRLEKENNQLKDLYRDGLVARVVLEANDKSLADARAKIERFART